jgi:hypothetical protein
VEFSEIFRSEIHCRHLTDKLALNGAFSLLGAPALIRKNNDGTIKYALGDSTWKMTTKRMAKTQAQRAFVERIFEEGKNIAGMADYQTRVGPDSTVM